MRMKQTYIIVLTTFFFLFCRNVTHGQTPQTRTNGQDTAWLITADVKGVNINELVNLLEKQTNVHFYYDLMQLDSFVFNLTVDKMPLREVLAQTFLPIDFRCTILENQYVFIHKESLDFALPNGFFEGKKVRNTSETASTFSIDDKEAEKMDKAAAIELKLYEIGDPSVYAAKNVVTMDGYVKDAKTGEAIVGASVYVDKPKVGVSTDAYGYYSLSLPKGRYILTVQSIGTRDVRRRIVLHSDGKMTIEVQSIVQTLRGVTISAQKISNVRGTQMGVQKVDIKSIKQVPVVFGEADILRVVTTLPGVKTVGEASTGLNVRGGSSDQNLILFNDAPIYNPAHFFGMFSAFNTEIVKDVDLYKSSIPARFGGRLSSVLNINTREGNKKKVTGSVGIGLITSRLNIEGPIIKDKSSFIFGARTTYANWLLKYLPEEYKNSQAAFYDVNLNITHEFNKNNTVYLSGYMSGDRFNLNSDTFYGYRNKSLSLKWKHVFGNKLNSVVTGGYNRYDYTISSEKLPISAYQLGFDINQTFLKTHFNYYLSNKHILDFGISTLFYQLNPGYYQPVGDKSLVKPDVIATEQALESAVYVSDNYTITNNLSVEAGLRWSVYNYLGAQNVNVYAPNLPKNEGNRLNTVSYDKNQVIKTYNGPEFRISARYALTDSFSIKAGFNTQRQFIHALSNTAAIAPTDIWKLSDPNITPQYGEQFSLGVFKNFKSNTIETSVEVYYKNIYNYLDFKSGAKLILNPNVETDVLPTTGKAYGVELLVKKLTGKLNGWVSYTWSRTLIKTDDPTAGEIINKGDYYPTNFDKPHDITIAANYRLSQRFNISVNSTYSTGRPITLPVGVYTYAGSVRTLYADRNAYRIPDYARTDVAVNIYGNHKVRQWLHSSWTVGVYNVLGRRNPYSVYYVSENGRTNGYQLSIFGAAIPFVNLNIQF
jgi:hypothetical protein